MIGDSFLLLPSWSKTHAPNKEHYGQRIHALFQHGIAANLLKAFKISFVTKLSVSETIRTVIWILTLARIL